MRKETSAGVKAGAVSGVPAGFVLAAFALVGGIGILESQFRANLILAPHIQTILLVAGVLLVVGFVAMTSFLGAIAGFIFVKTINKLPFRSTYFKAALPWGVLLIWSTVLVPLIYHPSPNVEIRYVGSYALLVVDSLLFAYLFKRWANPQQQPPTS